MHSERIFSFGGGRQSVAGLILAARGEIPYRTFVFALTGLKSESPDTLWYLNEIAHPYAAQHGLDLIVVQKRDRRGQPVDLYDRIMDPHRKGVLIPVRLDRTGKPAKRICTHDFKVAVIDQWIKQHNGTKTTVGIGFTVDELYRVKPQEPYTSIRRLDYPLIQLDLTVHDCVAIIEREGLPVPPKSACWYCPFMSTTANMHLRNTHPDLFREKVRMERFLTERRARDGFGPVYMTDAGARHKLPLDQVAGEQAELFADDAHVPYMCDGVHCFT